MKRILVSLLLIATVSAAAVAFLPTGEVLASSKDQVCTGANAIGGGTGCTGGGTQLNNVIKVFLNLFSVVLGIVAVVMVMVGGYKYISSNGDSSNITSAKHTIVYALIGIIIVAFAQFLVQFVLDKAT